MGKTTTPLSPPYYATEAWGTSGKESQKYTGNEWAKGKRTYPKVR